MSRPRFKSKPIATWIAIVGGVFGMHRFYLKGLRDVWGWLYPLPTLLGLYGVHRMRSLGQDDRVAWLLIPLLGLTLAAAMLCALVYALTADEKWNARHNPGGPDSRSSWVTVIGAIVALMLGAGILMATLAFSAQRYFESRVQAHAGWQFNRTGAG